jgi:4-hydroxybenzoyl-CoA thioesterase/acyl-CoA thioester hydrolase
MPAFRTTRRIEFADTDMAGIVHFARFFTFMESAEHAFLRSLGLSVVMEWEGENVTFPRVHASCDFVRPVRFEDELAIDLSVEAIGRKAIHYAVEMLLGDEVVARGKLSSVYCVIRPDGRLEGREIPSSFRARLEPDPPVV